MYPIKHTSTQIHSYAHFANDTHMYRKTRTCSRHAASMSTDCSHIETIDQGSDVLVINSNTFSSHGISNLGIKRCSNIPFYWGDKMENQKRKHEGDHTSVVWELDYRITAPALAEHPRTAQNILENSRTFSRTPECSPAVQNLPECISGLEGAY